MLGVHKILEQTRKRNCAVQDERSARLRRAECGAHFVPRTVPAPGARNEAASPECLAVRRLRLLPSSHPVSAAFAWCSGFEEALIPRLIRGIVKSHDTSSTEVG
jgi:hypothetical protein